MVANTLNHEHLTIVLESNKENVSKLELEIKYILS
jgi:hypothetical protein